MNHVNLIGKIVSTPKITENNNETKAHFTLKTAELVLNKVGEAVTKQDWHRVYAWGKWAKVLIELGHKDQQVAIEGKLKTRYFVQNGRRTSISEVEINDLIIL